MKKFFNNKILQIADILEIILAGLNKEILTVKNITSDKIKIINKSAIICHANGWIM